MPSITDRELVIKLLQATNDGRIKWDRADVNDRFAAKYADKWTLTVDRSEGDYETFWLALSNAEGEEILRIYSSAEERVDRLFELARRQALRIDEALSDLLKEIDGAHQQITDDDIPF